jgi:hypothetical protein
MAEAIPFDRRLARVVVRPSSRTPLTPNHLTTLSVLAGLGSTALFAAGQPALAHWGAGAFMLSIFIDHTDGELAGMTGKVSRFGHHYDYIVGSINYTARFIGIGIGLRARGLGDWALVLGLGAGLANPLVVTLPITLERVRGERAWPNPRRRLRDRGFYLPDRLHHLAGGPRVFLRCLCPRYDRLSLVNDILLRAPEIRCGRLISLRQQRIFSSASKDSWWGRHWDDAA